MPVLTALEPLAPQDPRTIGVFRLRARLGSGGMGRVYLGFSPAGRAVAVKVVHPELARDETFRRRFRQEVAAARRVSGAYTAPVIDAGPDDEMPWLATAYVAGPSVADAVAAAGPLPPDAVLRLGGGLAEALADIHATDLVHRDLKPSNVLLAADGPRVIDFGISRALETTVMTTTGVVIGTPAFMSPEQAGGKEAGRATDIFSLGAVLAYAATGRVPFGEGSPVTVLYRVVHAEPDLDGLDGPLRNLVARCLTKDPAARPTAREVAALAYQPAEDSGGPEDPGSFWPATLDELIRSYTDRAAVVPARLPDTMTVQRAADNEEPTEVPPDGDADPANDGPTDLDGSALVKSAAVITAGVPSATKAASPVAAGEIFSADVPGADEAPSDPGEASGQGHRASASGADRRTARPGHARRPGLSRAALATALAVLVAACVAAAVMLLPDGRRTPGANAPLAPGTATLHTSLLTPSLAASPAATLRSTPAAQANPDTRGTTGPSGETPTASSTPSSGPGPTAAGPGPTSAPAAPASSPTHAVSTPPKRSYPVPGLLGAPDWNGYCQAQGLGTAHLTQNNAYGWYCTGSGAGIDGNAVCAWTFKLSTSQVTNSITNFNDPNTWKCWSATEEISPPNWNGYCEARGLGAAHLTQNNAYGWYCTGSGAGIDGNTVCAWTNGASTLVVSRFQSFYDPQSWQCWV